MTFFSLKIRVKFKSVIKMRNTGVNNFIIINYYLLHKLNLSFIFSEPFTVKKKYIFLQEGEV